MIRNKTERGKFYKQQISMYPMGKEENMVGTENKKKIKIWPFILGIILLILLVGVLFFYFATASPSSPKIENIVNNPIEGMAFQQALLGFNEDYVNYVVFAIGGWKLHNPPLSDEIPKIKVIVDDEIYISKVNEGKTTTEKKQADAEYHEDIIIKTTKNEIVNAILSLNIKEYLQNSVEQGKTSLKLQASYTDLFSKGYLGLYKEMTGKSFTGSVVRIFGEG